MNSDLFTGLEKLGNYLQEKYPGSIHHDYHKAIDIHNDAVIRYKVNCIKRSKKFDVKDFYPIWHRWVDMYTSEKK